jgi:hypothetical protein
MAAKKKTSIKKLVTEVSTKKINVEIKIVGHEALLAELKNIQEAMERVKKALSEISFSVE